MGSFGSCSGCDEIQSIESVEEAIEFLTIMNRLIFIGTSIEEAIKYLENTKLNLWEDGKIEIDKIIVQLKERN